MNMRNKWNSLLFVIVVSLLMTFGIAHAAAPLPRVNTVPANTLFFDAENFTLQGNRWKVLQDRGTRAASHVEVLKGMSGAGESAATQEVMIPHDGTWRIWVRYMTYAIYDATGSFEVDILTGGKVLSSHRFNVVIDKSEKTRWNYQWRSFDVDLTGGQYTLRLRKEKKSAPAQVDCFLLTSDLEQKPDYVPFGPQTWMKVTLGKGYEKPVRIRIHATHSRKPWFVSYELTTHRLSKPSRKNTLFTDGENTGWCNISETVYQDSGALLKIYPIHSNGEIATHFNATIEFANQPNEDAVVKKFKVDYEPAPIRIVVPPNLESKENVKKLRSDMDFANGYGAIADNYDWPKAGRYPVKFPFFVTSHISPKNIDSQVMEREMKTLSYFGFNGLNSGDYFKKWGYTFDYIFGPGMPKGSFSGADIDKQRKATAANYAKYSSRGVKAQNIAFAILVDEPYAESLSKLAADAKSIEGFRNWIKRKNLTPVDLLVSSWDEVKPVTDDQQDKFPALYYYSQKYRTVALGNFLAMQAKLMRENWKGDFPIAANLSDVAVAGANLYVTNAVDYFTLMHDTDQNIIWSEDWCNGAATYQDASYNVELMRAAARKNGQVMGHYLIAYRGRTGYDTRLKAVSEVARGVKIFKSFMYGPEWSTNETEVWQSTPKAWYGQAAAIREIGAVEDELPPAMPKKVQVALLYSSATDIWNLKDWSYGFERMHTWLALTHAQIPVDVVHESAVAAGDLKGYKVCYLSDPNITRAAAQKLSEWVQAGGTLIMTAGAGERDEFNRPLNTLNDLLPYQRNQVETLQAIYGASGRRLTELNPQGTVTSGNLTFNILSQKQTFNHVNSVNGTVVKSTFADGSPAQIRSAAGKGTVICKGYMPSLDYMRRALVARKEAEETSAGFKHDMDTRVSEAALAQSKIEKSYNPWQYPAGLRDAIVQPVKDANVDLPIICSVPLVDAVYMTSDKGIVIPLANYTLQPIKKMTLDIEVDKPFHEVRSVHQGILRYEKIGPDKIRIHLPLVCTDFITIH